MSVATGSTANHVATDILLQIMVVLLMDHLSVNKAAAHALYRSGKEIGRILNCAAMVTLK